MSKKTEELRKEKNKKKKIIWCIVGVLFLAFIIWVIFLNTKSDLNYETKKIGDDTIYIIDDDSYIESKEESDLVMINVLDYGIMIAELYPNVAPITVKNFKKLVSEGFYSEETIKGEFEINGFKNNLSHTRGVLSMARAGANPETEYTMNSASSQFFIVHQDSTYLDGNYAAFGKLLNGYDVLDKIANVKTDENDKPLIDQVLKNIKFVKKYEGELK